MKSKQNIFSFMIAITVVINTISYTGFASEDTVKTDTITPTPTVTATPTGTSTGKILQLTLDDAIKMGLENSLIIKQLTAQIQLSGLKDEYANDVENSLIGGQGYIDSATQSIKNAQSLLDAAQTQINTALTTINNGIAPQDITVTAGLTIPAGTKISEFLKSKGLASLTDTVIANVKKQLESKQTELNTKIAQLESSKNLLSDSSSSLDAGKEKVEDTISEKLDVTDLSSLDAESAGKILSRLADANTMVTSYAQLIYKNQIALLIRKSYMDALNTKQVLEAKEKSETRAQEQYNYANSAYECGMKAKDDTIFAKLYLTGAKLEHKKALQENNNALIELKKNMSISLTKEIELSDIKTESMEIPTFDSGLKKGLEKRLEVVKAGKEFEIYEKNFETIDEFYGASETAYKEAQLLKDKSALELEKAKLDVEASIRQSFETYKTMEQMVEESKEMVQQAKESVEIAEFKYKEGFGTDSSLLKKLDLDSGNGTMLEVIAAQENLAQVEQKVIEIEYGFNLARSKYLNDIGSFQY